MTEYSSDNPDTPPDVLVYMNSLAWIAHFVKRRAVETEFSEEAVQAQVTADLKKMLDENWKTH